MGFLNPKNHLDRSNLANKVYEGWVVDNNDPLKQQRVKVRIPQLHRNVPDEHLPWCRPTQNGNQVNAGSGVGSVRIPPNGAKVGFYLDENDPHNPRYGGSPSTSDVVASPLIDDDYPDVYGDVDQAGNVTRVNTKAGSNTFSYTHASGSSVAIDNAGNVTVHSKGVLKIESEGDIHIVAKGKLILHAQGETNIKGSTIQLNDDSAAETVETATPATRPTIPSKAGQTKM